MGYWRGGTATPYSVEMILRAPDGNGQCGAWAELLSACAHVHGLGATKVRIDPDRVRNPGAQGFLVKKWDFGTPSGTGHYPYLLDHDVLDETGIPGQDNDNPPGGFKDHFVVRQNGGQIYDPSYGVGPYTPDSAHENAAIDGIYDGPWARPQDPGVQELTYSP